SLFVKCIIISVFYLINRVILWFKLLIFLGAVNLAFLRVGLFISISEQGSLDNTPIKDNKKFIVYKGGGFILFNYKLDLGKIILLKTKLDNILDPSDIKYPGYKNINNPDSKLELAENSTRAFILRDKDSNLYTGFNNNYIEILYTLFILEYNILYNIFQKIISGIPGSSIDYNRIPFSLTEEFISVYRIYFLIPEDLTFKNIQILLKSGISFADLFYSFGINYPGAIINNNYPNFLYNLYTPDSLYRDIGTVDIIYNYKYSIPRYCTFRRILYIIAPKTLEELTGSNKELAKQLSEVYNGDIKLVNILVESYSKPLIPGFGFSKTVFYIFIIIVLQHLKSNRFITG
ncbi:unnamed protein product, partial [Clonostachys chloroleuca]